jgi:hypothetical protein
LRLQAELSFVYETEREAKAAVDSVSPDNIETPPGLAVETVRKDRHLLASVHCEKSLETFIATLDDLLACISVAERTFATVKAS